MSERSYPPARRRVPGFSVLEIVIASVLILIVMVPVFGLAQIDHRAGLKRLGDMELLSEGEGILALVSWRRVKDLESLPRSLEQPLPPAWESYVRDLYQPVSDPTGQTGSGERPYSVRLAFQPDIKGKRGLHRLLVRLTPDDPDRSRLPVEIWSILCRPY